MVQRIALAALAIFLMLNAVTPFITPDPPWLANLPLVVAIMAFLLAFGLSHIRAERVRGAKAPNQQSRKHRGAADAGHKRLSDAPVAFAIMISSSLVRSIGFRPSRATVGDATRTSVAPHAPALSGWTPAEMARTTPPIELSVRRLSWCPRPAYRWREDQRPDHHTTGTHRVVFCK